MNFEDLICPAIDILLKENPSPSIELNFCNDYTLLLAVMMSAQATDKIVNVATKKLFMNYKTPEDFVALGAEGFMSYINILNYYKTKSRNIIKMSEILVDRFNSRPPNSLEELILLPGIGIKTAKVYLASAHNQPFIGVDTHVFRVAKRLGIVNHNASIAEVDKMLHKHVPDRYKTILNHLFVLHGRYICTAKKPKCTECKISHLCEKFQNENRNNI